MKKRSCILIFFGSITLGFMIHRVIPAENLRQTAQTSSARQELATKADRANDARQAKFKNLAKQFATMESDDVDAYCANIAPQERGSFLETLLREEDPSGYSSQSYWMIDKILGIWATEDYEGAWIWSQQITNDAYRRYISAKLLAELAENDPTRALNESIEISAEDPKFHSSVGLHLLNKAASKSAGDFNEVLAKLPLSDISCDSGFEFAKDFDFKKAADGTSALLRKQKELPAAFPHNFLTTWGERDPDAAFAWYATAKKGRQINFQYLLDGIEKQGISGATSAWIVGKIEESEKFRGVIIEGLCQDYGYYINRVTKALPDSKSSDHFLTEILVKQSQSGEVDFATMLDGMSSPQVRLEALSKVKKDGWYSRGKISETQYQAWGVTQQQFEAILPPAKKH
jgi:hypothetical protein